MRWDEIRWDAMRSDYPKEGSAQERERKGEMGWNEMRWKNWEDMRWNDTDYEDTGMQWATSKDSKGSCTEERFHIQKTWHQIGKSGACCCEAQESCPSPIAQPLLRPIGYNKRFNFETSAAGLPGHYLYLIITYHLKRLRVAARMAELCAQATRWLRSTTWNLALSHSNALGTGRKQQKQQTNTSRFPTA